MDTCILPGIHPCTAQIPAYSEHPLSAVPFSMVFSIFGNLHSSIKAHLTSAFRYRTLAHLLPQCFWPPRPKVEKAVDTEASSGLLVNRLSQTSANHFKIIASVRRWADSSFHPSDLAEGYGDALKVAKRKSCSGSVPGSIRLYQDISARLKENKRKERMKERDG